MRLFLSYHALCLYLCRYILSYDLKSFSSFVGSLLLKPCGCFSSYIIQSFSPFSCLSVAFLRSFVYKPVSLATELSFSLFSILSLPSLHNKVYTLFLYFSFLQTGFSNLLIFSLTNKFHSFYSSTCFIRRSCKFSISSFSIRFCSCRFSLLLFFFPPAIRLVLNTVKSCLQAYVLSSQKYYISFRKKKSCNAVLCLISQSQR